jgi:hypothetical protein
VEIFRVLEVLPHEGPLPVNTIRPMVKKAALTSCSKRAKLPFQPFRGKKIKSKAGNTYVAPRRAKIS